MTSPDPERALEDEAPAQPGARAGEPRGEDDEKVRSVAREAGERAGRAAEGLRDPRGVGGRPAVEDRLGGEASAPPPRADAPAPDVAAQPGPRPDHGQALARQPPPP